MRASNYHAWIFVSHARDDLPRVREVRNYLESEDASPLLFHLKALADPKEFWPLTEREISAPPEDAFQLVRTYDAERMRIVQSGAEKMDLLGSSLAG